MTNLKNELLQALQSAEKTFSDISYGIIYLENYKEDIQEDLEENIIFIEYIHLFSPNSKPDDLPNEICYDDSYGEQRLFGYIVFKDNSWLKRREYDGNEWWEYSSCPTKEDTEAMYDYLKNL